MQRTLALTLLLSALAASAAEPPPEHGETALDQGEPRVAASLRFDQAQARPGDVVRVGVLFQLDPGWHISWRNPGDAGLPSEVEVRLPGSEVGPLHFPFPDTVRDASGTLTSYGHHGEVLLYRDVRLPLDAKAAVQVEAKVDVLVCEDSCIPGRLLLGRSLPLGPQAQPGPDAPLFARAADAVPRESAPLGLTWEAQVAAPGLVRGGPLDVTLQASCSEAPRCGGLALVGEDAFAPDVVEGVEGLRVKTEGPLKLRLTGRGSPDGAPGDVVLRGAALLADGKGGRVAVELEAPLGAFVAGAAVPPAPAAHNAPALEAVSGPTAAEAGGMGTLWVLLLAFAGGAVLNLMPCVFPVLALKVFSFAKLVGGGRRKAAVHAAAYTLGIEAALLLLAGVVLAVRAAGARVGWGFQFQEPLFVAAVSAVLVVFALNLFGVFTVGGDATALTAGVERTDGWMRSAGEGVLAVVLATPCSAPFLGTAVGFALAGAAPLVVGVFLALGLGLAAPFVLLVLVPGGVKRLPRPGVWMERGKQVLGFALLATAAWLAWVLGQLAGVDGMGRLLGFLVVVALGTWLWGLAQARGTWALRLAALAVVVVAGSVALRFTPEAHAREAALTEGWQPYSEEALAEGLAQGRPVFVDFTADWCLTCKYNERTVLSAPAVREAFARSRAVLLVVDYTRRDERISQMLAAHGRAGVPLYLVYRPGARSTPEVLPELLTEERVLGALAHASAGCTQPGETC